MEDVDIVGDTQNVWGPDDDMDAEVGATQALWKGEGDDDGEEKMKEEDESGVDDGNDMEEEDAGEREEDDGAEREEEDEEPDDEDEERRKRKERRRERKKKKKERKKRRREGIVSGDDDVKLSDLQQDGGGWSEGDPEEQHKNRRGAKRHKRRDEVTMEDAMDRAREVIEQMHAAAAADEDAAAVSKPALAKLQLVEGVAREVVQPKWAQWYIQEGVVPALAKWLAPLQEGGIPNLAIRQRVLEILTRLPLTTDNLQGTDLGHRLIALWKNPKELEENRRKIRGLVSRWMRPAMGVRWSHRARREEQEMEELNVPSRVAGDDEAPTLAQLSASRDAKSAPYIRARVPFNQGFDFKVMPKSAVERGDGRRPMEQALRRRRPEQRRSQHISRQK